MGIAFNFHELTYLDAAWDTHSSHVVACEINEHDVFSLLFGVVFQLFRESLIALLIAAAWARASNGANSDLVLLEAYQQFRRGSYDVKVMQITPGTSFMMRTSNSGDAPTI